MGVNSYDDNGFTPIQWAIESNELDAKFLVEKGANLFMKDNR
jgi:ankyrin repeat protein